MALFSPQEETQLREMFSQQMVNDVTIMLFTQRETRLAVPGLEQQTELCAAANRILEEVAALSDKLHLEVYDYRVDVETLRAHDIERVPAVILGTDGARPARFLGVVSGYEFATLVQDIVDLSTGNIELSEQSQARLQGLQEDLHIQVFVTPT